MDADLVKKLQKRIQRIESVDENENDPSTDAEPTLAQPLDMSDDRQIFNPCNEYKEFSRRQIQGLMQTFDKLDTDKDKHLNFNELKYMMEKLGIPQTHLGLKEMIKEVDEDHDGMICFREFLLIFRKAASEDTPVELVLHQLYSMLMEIDVSKEGVGGAKNFFEAKAAALTAVGDKYQREIREEQEQRKREEDDKQRRKMTFQNRLALFQS
ncbi:unnamed protein product [Didymodactylos carnosus]|uniref:EF-hand domain-containing protein n=1 Tax=Didymodactylos carnosus TaxID=1234261 RepID=A0A814BRP2_9BILA|nr:unnamed protein product [Didymodactylos carnosus]CAF0985783.1 unnamed protein product [Didymodactylos carnosus]CAF3709026.1 unnamed protein product [Didymodactylos carnosus]CAF3756076.1 unnamed protein product [Didymodactylos carnosus]